jgi:hypothetical protein
MPKKKPVKPIEEQPPHIMALLKKYPAMAEAAKYGVDIALLLDNLKRPVSQRIRRNQEALNAMDKLRKAKLL